MRRLAGEEEAGGDDFFKFAGDEEEGGKWEVLEGGKRSELHSGGAFIAGEWRWEQ